MPRKSKFPPSIYHAKNGQDRVRIYRDGQPHDVWLGRTGSEQARAAYARLVAELTANGGQLPPKASEEGQASVAEVVARWLASEVPKYDTAAKEPGQYRRALTVLVRLYGPTPAVDFGTDSLEALRLAMASGSWLAEVERERILHPPKPSPEHPPGGATVGWCRTTTNRMIVRVRTVWRWAEGKGLVPRGSWEHLRTVKRFSPKDQRVRQTTPRKGCTREELDLVLEECRPQPRAMLLVQWLTGMRSCEVRLFRPCDLDKSGDVWLYRPPDKTGHKDDGRVRVVAIGPEAQAVLARWLVGCEPDQYVFRPRTGSSRHPYYSASSYAQLIATACERCGTKLQPSQCRHAFRLRITRETGQDAARAAMGHRSIQTTQGYHAEVDVLTAVDVARRLG